MTRGPGGPYGSRGGRRGLAVAARRGAAAVSASAPPTRGVGARLCVDGVNVVDGPGPRDGAT